MAVHGSLNETCAWWSHATELHGPETVGHLASLGRLPHGDEEEAEGREVGRRRQQRHSHSLLCSRETELISVGQISPKRASSSS
jgi:hypothetical protein